VRGGDNRTGQLFSYVDLEARVRRDHPLRAIRTIVNEALSALEREFAGLYSPIGRPSIPPEKLLRAMLLQAFYSIRSERLLMERLEYDLLFRWFVGIGVDDAVWDHSVFSKNRDRLLEGDIAAKFLAGVLAQSKVKKLLSSDHFSVDGHADRSLGLDEEHQAEGRLWRATGARRRAQCRSRLPWPETLERYPCFDHRSDARLYRKGKGKETKLCFIGHGLMENRHGLLVDACLTLADGHAERVAALHMIEPRADRPTARRTPTAVAVQLMGERPGTAAMPSASASASASRRHSAGSRPSPGKSSQGSVAVIASHGLLPSLPPPTIWCGCPS
jgi:transposase